MIPKPAADLLAAISDVHSADPDAWLEAVREYRATLREPEPSDADRARVVLEEYLMHPRGSKSLHALAREVTGHACSRARAAADVLRGLEERNKRENQACAILGHLVVDPDNRGLVDLARVATSKVRALRASVDARMAEVEDLRREVERLQAELADAKATHAGRVEQAVAEAVKRVGVKADCGEEHVITLSSGARVDVRHVQSTEVTRPIGGLEPCSGRLRLEIGCTFDDVFRIREAWDRAE